MSSIVNLPNGSVWDNDIQFSDQQPAAQTWYFETLKIVADGIANGNLNDDVVKRHAILNKSATREIMCYSHLEREDLYLKVDKPYRHKDWHKVLDGISISNADWYNIENWIYPAGIKFTVELKPEDS